MADEHDNTGFQPAETPARNGRPPAGDERAGDESADGQRAPWLAPYRWAPGVSGNPSGRPRESGSLAAALRRVGIKPAKTRAELARIAQQLGLDADEAQNIDVIAGLVYDGITQLLIRTVKGSTGAGDKLVGLLQLLFKALDGDERRITLSSPSEEYLEALRRARERFLELGESTSAAVDGPKRPAPTHLRLPAGDQEPPDDGSDGDVFA